MTNDQLKAKLRQRLEELRQEQNKAFLSLGAIGGAIDEVSRTLTLLDEEGEGWPSPFSEGDNGAPQE